METTTNAVTLIHGWDDSTLGDNLTIAAFQLSGRLTDNDGDGYDNVTYKVKSRCLKLYRAYSAHLVQFVKC